MEESKWKQHQLAAEKRGRFERRLERAFWTFVVLTYAAWLLTMVAP